MHLYLKSVRNHSSKMMLAIMIFDIRTLNMNAMKKICQILLFMFATGNFSVAQTQIIHHELKVNVSVGIASIDVIDSIRIPANYLKEHDTLEFNLNANFAVKSLNPSCKISEIKEKIADTSGDVKSRRYIVLFSKANSNSFVLPLHYSGKVTGKIKTGAAEYARGFSETSGIISNDGIYLANSTIWVPEVNEDLFTFNLTATIDSAWGIVSQGTRTKNEVIKNKKVVRYESPDPTDEVYLIAAKWTEYSKESENIKIQAVLRSPDTALANRYINATVGYLALYNKLIGPYPYTKFTVVENFWETGYGMPSFTLLGSQVIRFPFILTSSYPHELLHNYWGNSVYVNGDKGNWCEGLTAYMADHLIKEQAGQGNEYRRTTLQKFTDFVNETNDFPITQFTSRHNAAEEAIGYGKTLMVYEMLRYDFGDELFKKAFAKFYHDNKFKKASFDDIEKSFEEVTGQNLKPFFDQWLLRKGAPTLQLSNVNVSSENKQYKLVFTLSQVQKEEPFDLKVPVVIYLEGEENVTVKDFVFTKREESFTLTFDKRPVRIDVDPQFNVFRRLDKEEVPTSISQILGAKEAVMILPKSSLFLKEYSDLAEQWKQTQNAQGNELEIKFDSDLQELPDKPSWIVGFENKFAPETGVFDNYKDFLSKETLQEVDTLKKTGGLVYVFKNAKNKQITNGFLASNNQKMIEGIKRKVTHYSKYSYLGFEGNEADNKLKGEFPTLTSPLSFYIKYESKILQTKGKLKPRKALM
jgi:aminopeptidase N